MKERRSRPGVSGPLILIGIGVLLLLNQMGRLPWDVWSTLWRFWPVIFILIGLDILIGASRSTLLYVMGLLIAIVVVGGIIGYAVYQGGRIPVGERTFGSETVLEGMQDADRGLITLKLGVARADIGALSDSPNFVEGEIVYARYSLKAEKAFDVSGGRAVFSLEARSRSVPFWNPGDQVSEGWNLKFTPRIPLEMKVETGVGKVVLDLSKLKVTQLEVRAGVAETIITFPAAAEQTYASIEAGVGSITVRIPDGVGAKIHVSKGLGSVQARNARLRRSGDDYVTADYSTAENRLDLDIRGGIGSISIE